MYSIHAHKGSHSCLGGVTYALGANDRGVTGAWESFVPLTPVHLARGCLGTRARARAVDARTFDVLNYGYNLIIIFA